ncbi:MAG: sugar phosphate isomerase/epimerase [Armatimonadetes bacterium]|nr:sugar phosphate isomerase/epimerase [Armatimonadota bacterium]
MPVPQLSVMLFPFHHELNEGILRVGTLVEELRASGIMGVEPMPMCGQDQPTWWGELHRAASDVGMRISCCDIIGDLVGEDDSERQKAIDAAVWGIEWCREVNCAVALLAGSRPGSGMSNEEGRRIYAESLAMIADRTEGSGVTLTIEDFGVYPDFTCSAAHVLEVVRLSGRPDLKVTYDNGNFLFADEKPTECLQRVKDHFVYVHLKDFALGDPDGEGGLKSLAGNRYIGCPIGEGVAEVAPCLTMLRQEGYDGWVSLEVGVSPPLDEAVRSAAYVNREWD